MKVINGLLGKVVIKGKITLKTGMHISAGNEFASIGSVDTVIVRDTLTKRPYIPGSSIKGKMRYLMARSYANNSKLSNIDEEPDQISRLFGQGGNTIVLSRLQFFDVFMNEESVERLQKINTGLFLTEVKYENTINRITAEANPRQLERAVAGSVFDFKLCYNVENEDELEEDIKIIKLCIEMIEDDYLGGHGSRGYGRVEFSDWDFEYKEYNDTSTNVLDMVKNSFEEGR
jgi:CRISPR-associated protein Csm3